MTARVGATIEPALQASQWTQNETSQLNITQTTPSTPGSPTVSLLWTAPPSETVTLITGGGFRDNAGNGRVIAIPETFQGTGPGGTPVITDAEFEEYGLRSPNEATGYCYFSRRALLTGLTAGLSYYTRFVFYADNSGSADITVRDLAVIPHAAGPAVSSDRQLIRGVDWPPTQFAQDDESQLDITATAATPGNPDVAVYFVAPTSGRVLLTVGGSARDKPSGTNRVFLNPALYERDENGPVVFDGDTVVQRGFGSPPDATEYWYGSRHTIAGNLTPRRTYFVRVNQWVDGGATADAGVRELSVEPIP